MRPYSLLVSDTVCAEIYFLLSEFPISREAEDDMELLSDIVTWGEIFNPVFQKGIYTCARCDNKLYCSEDKWKGPCVWPSFRKAITAESVFSVDVAEYNGYSCTVRERYCGICKLFLGHQFEDGIIKGDTHPDARWRE